MVLINELSACKKSLLNAKAEAVAKETLLNSKDQVIADLQEDLKAKDCVIVEVKQKLNVTEATLDKCEGAKTKAIADLDELQRQIKMREGETTEGSIYQAEIKALHEELQLRIASENELKRLNDQLGKELLEEKTRREQEQSKLNNVMAEEQEMKELRDAVATLQEHLSRSQAQHKKEQEQNRVSD